MLARFDWMIVGPTGTVEGDVVGRWFRARPLALPVLPGLPPSSRRQSESGATMHRAALMGIFAFEVAVPYEIHWELRSDEDASRQPLMDVTLRRGRMNVSSCRFNQRLRAALRAATKPWCHADGRLHWWEAG